MIKSIEIENFRGIQQGKLDGLTPLTILVGPNGCGKSTILDALLLGGSLVPSVAVQQLGEERLRINRGARWLLYRAGQLGPSTIEVTSTVADRRTIIINPAVQSDKSLRLLFTVRQKDWQAEVASIGDITTSLNTGNILLAGVSDTVLVDLMSTTLGTSLHSLFTAVVSQGRRSEINAIIRTILPTADHIEILTEGDAPVIHIVYATHSVPVALSGDGIHDLLRICLELASRPEGVVLLEEPEVHQYPGALRQSALAILAAIRRGIQVILTTHDLELIDFLLSETQSDEELDMISVRRLQLRDGCLRSSNLSGSEASLSRSAIQDDLR